MEKSPSWSRAHDWKSCRPLKGLEGSNPSFSASSSEIPNTAPFPASPKTALCWEFLRFPPRLASLDSRRRGTGMRKNGSGPLTLETEAYQASVFYARRKADTRGRRCSCFKMCGGTQPSAQILLNPAHKCDRISRERKPRSPDGRPDTPRPPQDSSTFISERI